jgi:hypothetical protein
MTDEQKQKLQTILTEYGERLEMLYGFENIDPLQSIVTETAETLKKVLAVLTDSGAPS